MYGPFWTFLILCVICATVCRILAIKVRRRDARGYGSEDTRLTQEIHRDLNRMQDRIESLETILMDRQDRSTYYDEAR